MRYYALYDNDKLTAIGTGHGGTEITEKEYNQLLTEIRAKVKWVNDVYSGTPISDVPVEWQEEIQRRVNERIESEAQQSQEQVSDSELAQAVEAIL